MATPSLTEQMRAYEDNWVAMVQEPEEMIVGSGPEPLDAQLDAERRGYQDTILFWVPPVGTILAPLHIQSNLLIDKASPHSAILSNVI